MNASEATPAPAGVWRGSIGRTVSSWTLLAALVGMTVYTFIEFVIDPPQNLGTFVLHHFLHVAFIGVAVWWASLQVIRRFVINPVDEVFVHLRRVASGRLEYISLQVETHELSEVIGSVNRLVGKLLRRPDQDSISRALDELRKLRRELRAIADKLGDDVVPVMRHLSMLEEEMLSVVQLAEESPGWQRVTEAPAPHSKLSEAGL